MHMVTQSEARKLAAERESDATLIRAKATSEAQKITADGIEREAGAKGRAEAEIEALRARNTQNLLEAEAAGLEAKAEALKKYNDAATFLELAKMYIEAERDVHIDQAKSMGSALSNAQIRMYGGGDGTVDTIRGLFTTGFGLGEILEGVAQSLPEGLRQRFTANGVRGLLGRPYTAGSLKQLHEQLGALVGEHMRTKKARDLPFPEAVSRLGRAGRRGRGGPARGGAAARGQPERRAGRGLVDTVVPASDARYRALRQNTTAEATLHPLDGDFSLSSMPYLASAWERGDLAIVHGVGHPDSSLSHFDATDMWEKGSLDFHTRTGWLGRTLDNLVDDHDPLLGVSVGGLSPSMYAASWRPYALEDPWDLPWTRDFASEAPSLAAGLDTMLAAPIGTDLASEVRASQALVRDVGGRLEPLLAAYDVADDPDEGSRLATDLDLVAAMINTGIPTRAFHVSHDGFDTHADQQYMLPELLMTLDGAISSFQAALGANAERVVIATWTEFGRRPEWNGVGTEHGTAGTQFVVGPRVVGGHHGEPSPLDRFDDDGNFLVTTDFRDYLGGVVQHTLGVDADIAMPGATRPVEVVR